MTKIIHRQNEPSSTFTVVCRLYRFKYITPELIKLPSMKCRPGNKTTFYLQ